MTDRADKLIFTTVAELSDAVFDHIDLQGTVVSAYGRRLVLIGNIDFNITDTRHWMLVVEAMPDFNFKLQQINSGGWGGIWSAEFSMPDKKGHACKYNDPGIAIGLAALRAKGVDCEWRADDV